MKPGPRKKAGGYDFQADRIIENAEENAPWGDPKFSENIGLDMFENEHDPAEVAHSQGWTCPKCSTRNSHARTYCRQCNRAR